MKYRPERTLRKEASHSLLMSSVTTFCAVLGRGPMASNTPFRRFALFILTPAVLLSGHAPADAPQSSLLLLIDTSGSMGDPVGGGNSEIKIEAAKSAALGAVDQASRKRDVEVAVLAFEGDCANPVSSYAGFTSDFQALSRFIRGLQPGGGTPMAEAVRFANQFMKNRGASSARDQMIVLLADGENSCGDVSDALRQLRQSGVIFRHETVGFGIEPNSAAALDLQNIATASGGEYHHAQDATQLGNLFMDFVNTFTVIDMLGMFGEVAATGDAAREQEDTATARQPSASPATSGQVTDLLGQFRPKPSAQAPVERRGPRPPPGVPDHATRVQEWNGIEVYTAARVLTPAAASCIVDWVAGYTEEEYEQWKAKNHGEILNVWQLDFFVYNGSGRWLNAIHASYSIAGEWPPCTSWTRLPHYSTWVGWTGTLRNIQRGSGNPVAPGETLSQTELQLVYHEDEPAFERWEIYNVEFGDSVSVADAARGKGPT